MSDVYNDPIIEGILDRDPGNHAASRASSTACAHCRAARWRVGVTGTGLSCYCSMMACDVATPDEPCTVGDCTGRILAEDTTDADEQDNDERR